MDITWYGNSCFRITERGHTTVLTDPSPSLDLAQRGPGELAGTRQAGLPRLRAARLADDLDLMRQAQADARRHHRCGQDVSVAGGRTCG